MRGLCTLSTWFNATLSSSKALQAGPTFAGSDRFNVTIRGVGGHAAAPHTTKDPVLAASVRLARLYSKRRSGSSVPCRGWCTWVASVQVGVLSGAQPV